MNTRIKSLRDWVPSPILSLARKARQVSRDLSSKEERPTAKGERLLVVNRYRNPDLLGLSDAGSHQSGERDLGIYTHVHAQSAVVPHWNRSGAFAITVSGVSDHVDTHLALGGRQGDGAFRLGMIAGKTYTFSASLRLTAPLAGKLAATRLSVAPGWTIGGENIWHSAVSEPVPNAAGEYRVSSTFTIPKDATDAWIRLVCGMSKGGGSVSWADFQLIAGESNESFFQGSSPDTALYTHRWAGTPHLSHSFRAYLAKRDIATRLQGDELNVQFLEELQNNDVSARAYKYLRQASGGTSPTAIAVRSLSERGLGRNKKAIAELAQLPLGVRGVGPYVRSFAQDLFAAKRYSDCATVLHRVINDDPSDYLALYQLGTCLEKTGKVAEGTVFTKQAALLDPELPVAADLLIKTDPKALLVRRTLLLWVEKNLAEIQARANSRVAAPSRLAANKPIFTYWHQGFENAPPLVKRTHESLLRFHDAERVHILSEKNLDAYIDIPTVVRERVANNYTHLSDLIRLNLLNKHGGYWVDATCLFTGSIDESDPSLVDQDFFFFNYSGPRVGTWFFSQRLGSYTGLLLEEAMYLWWEEEGYLADYFLLHFMFEVLYWLDPQVQSNWESERHEHPRKALRLLNSLSEPANSPVFAEALTGNWVHKLSYKLPESVHVYDTCYSAILRNEHLQMRFADNPSI